MQEIKSVITCDDCKKRIKREEPRVVIDDCDYHVKCFKNVIAREIKARKGK